MFTSDFQRYVSNPDEFRARYYTVVGGEDFPAEFKSVMKLYIDDTYDMMRAVNNNIVDVIEAAIHDNSTVISKVSDVMDLTSFGKSMTQVDNVFPVLPDAIARVLSKKDLADN